MLVDDDKRKLEVQRSCTHVWKLMYLSSTSGGTERRIRFFFLFFLFEELVRYVIR